MLTSEVLDLAADEIERRGWSSGGGWFNESDSHPVCVEGAIAAAMGVRGGPGYRCPAYSAVSEYVGQPPWIWNDDLAIRHFDAVDGWPEAVRLAALDAVATLRAVSAVVSARESQPAAVSA